MPTTTLTTIPVQANWYDDGECWVFDPGADPADHDPAHNAFVIPVDTTIVAAYQQAITALHDAVVALVIAMGLSTEGPELADVCAEFLESPWDAELRSLFHTTRAGEYVRCVRCGAHRDAH